ncbi:MAG: hypothetical protein WD904_12495 [Dehalococcoidia bacterium]
MCLQALAPTLGGIFREHFGDYGGQRAVGRRDACGVPGAFVCEFRAPEADGEGVPLVSVRDGDLDLAFSAGVAAVGGRGRSLFQR